MMGERLMSDPIEIAAAYLFYPSRNHPFIDGNKRTALAACLVFLESNDLLPDAKLPIDEWEKLVVDVAANRLDRKQTTARLRRLLKRRRVSRLERVAVSGTLRMANSARRAVKAVELERLTELLH
jgi:death on curing protein